MVGRCQRGTKDKKKKQQPNFIFSEFKIFILNDLLMAVLDGSSLIGTVEVSHQYLTADTAGE